MLAILDYRAPKQVVAFLRERGYEILVLPPSPLLPEPIAAHPDMLLFFARDKILCSKAYYEIARAKLERIGAVCGKQPTVSEQEHGGRYPRDVLFNAAAVGRHLFCLASATAKEILSEYPAESVISVRQGYAKCSILPVSEKALITADPSIARMARQGGFEVLQISPGGIALPGYNTGFLGGAASALPYGESDEILFCGDLSQHPDGARIEQFCIAHQKNPVSIKGIPLTDVGTLFLI